MRQRISSALNVTPLCACATVTPDGKAHIHAAYFAFTDDFELCFLSHPGSIHCRNLVANPSMAVAVFASTQEWTRPDRGLQLLGRCAEARGQDMHRAEYVYGTRFPAFESWRRSLSPGEPGLEYRLFWFEPRTIKLFDEAEFGDATWIIVAVSADR